MSHCLKTHLPRHSSRRDVFHQQLPDRDYLGVEPKIVGKHPKWMIYNGKLYEQMAGQISIIPKPELKGFWGSSLIKPPFRVTSADVVIICP